MDGRLIEFCGSRGVLLRRQKPEDVVHCEHPTNDPGKPQQSSQGRACGVPQCHICRPRVERYPVEVEDQENAGGELRSHSAPADTVRISDDDISSVEKAAKWGRWSALYA